MEVTFTPSATVDAPAVNDDHVCCCQAAGNVCRCSPCNCSSSLALERENAADEDGFGGSFSSVTLSFYVGGMTCASCAQRLTTALQRIEGVVSAKVSFLSQQAEVVVCAAENAAVAGEVTACVVRLGFTVLGSESPGAWHHSHRPPHYTARDPNLEGSNPLIQHEGGHLAGGDDDGRGRGGPLPASPAADAARTQPPSAVPPRAEMAYEAPRLVDTTFAASLLPVANNDLDLSSSESESGSDSNRDTHETATPVLPPPPPSATPLQPTEPLTKTAMLIEGMSCTSCAARIENELQRVPGVTEASVNFAVMSGGVLHDAKKVSAKDLVKFVCSLGYTASLQSSRPLPTAATTTGNKTASETVPNRSGHDSKKPFPIPRHSSGASISILIDDADMVVGVGSERSSTFGPQNNRPHPQRQSNEEALTDDTTRGATHATGSTRYVHRFLVEGMSCASCAARIEAALKALPFVVDCTVSFTTASAVATTDRSFSDDNVAVEKVMTDLGYGVTALGRRRAPAPSTGNYQSTDAAVVFVEERDAPVAQPGEMDNENDDVARTRAALERRQEIAKQRNNFVNSAVLSIPLVIAMLIMAFTDIMETSFHMAMIVDAVQLLCATPIVFVFGKQFFVGAWRSAQHGAYTMDTLVAIGTGCSYAYSVIVFVVSSVMGMHLMTYFDTAGMLTSFMLLGRFLEANAKRTTSGALIELMSLVPTMATVVTGDGDVRVSTSALHVGDHVRVLAGDRIPVDGAIVEGQSDVDEQLVTGESVPKPCGRGDSVVGGTLNVTATLVLEVTKVGEDTLLSQILKIVQEAQNTKPAVQRIADRVAMYFVPFVVLSSLVTLVVWLFLGFMHAYPAHWRPHMMPSEAFAFNFFIATVVAACPCALGLATPTAIMVGTGVGAQNGVLVKSGVTLESVRKTDCVVFDKTGTITNGQLKVKSSQSFGVAPGAAQQLVKRLVAAVEGQSTHPIAKAVTRDLTLAIADAQTDAGPQTDVLSAVTHAGRGVEARVSVTETVSSFASSALSGRNAGDSKGSRRGLCSNADASRTAAVSATSASGLLAHVAAMTNVDGGEGGQYVQEYRVLVGNLAFMHEQQQHVPREVTNAVEQCHSQGQTTIVASVDGTAVLVVALADEPKSEAFGVIEFLHQHKIRTLMVTGDNRLVAASVARAVGISFDNVRAEALPGDKAAIVKELQAEGHRVMFVGDGINDSPALAQADVGVALGAGTEVAIEAADAVLVRNSLVDLLSLRKLSDMTVRRIYGNFVWAFGYNILMLPLASGLLYPLLLFQLPPVVAGAAMVMSSLSVLTSSLTIRCFTPYKQEDFIGTAWR